MGKKGIHRELERRADYVEALRVTLLRADDRYTVLPLIHEIFGDSDFYEFLEVFAGTTIRIPSREDMERAVRDVNVYFRLVEAEDRKSAIQELSRSYEVSEDMVCRIERSMQDLLKGLKDTKKLDRLSPSIQK